MDAANCAAVLLSVPISYHFHGCTALLVALVVVSGAILNIHLYLLPFYLYLWVAVVERRSLTGELSPDLQLMGNHLYG